MNETTQERVMLRPHAHSPMVEYAPAHLLDIAIEGIRAFIARIESAEETKFGDDYEQEVAIALTDARSILAKLERGTGE